MDKKAQIIAAIGTILFHLCVLLILLNVYLKREIPQDEEGLEVMFGMTDNGGNDFRGGGFPGAEEMFKEFFKSGGFSSFFGGANPFGGGRQPQNKGENIKVTINITLKEAYNGCTKTINFSRPKPCSHCNGTGSADGHSHVCTHCNGTGMATQMQQMGPGSFQMTQSPCPHCNGTGRDENVPPCSHCHGSGKGTEFATETINIPKGIFNNAALTLQGKGATKIGGENGNLIVIVNVVEDGNFKVERDYDLVYFLSVPFNQALLGFDRDIECIDGSKVHLHVPELTPTNTPFKFDRKGMPDINRPSTYGDLYVVVEHTYPDTLTQKQRDLLKNF